jgi:cell division protease FtsH
MSAKLGAVKYGTGDAEPFMGRDYGHQRDYSEDIAAGIDGEVRDLIEAAHDEAWEILVQYRDVLDQMVLELVEKETLTKPELERILTNVRKRPPHNAFSGFGKRTPSDKPPVEIPLSLRKAPAPAQSNGSTSNGSPNGSGSGSAAGSPTGAASPQAQPGEPGAFGPEEHRGAPYGQGPS